MVEEVKSSEKKFSFAGGYRIIETLGEGGFGK